MFSALYHTQNGNASGRFGFCMANYSQKWKFSILTAFFTRNGKPSAVAAVFATAQERIFKAIQVFCLIPSLRNKPQPFQLADVLHTGGDQIDAGGLDAGMPQDVGQLRDVLIHPVKGPGKQVAQVVGKHLGGFHLRVFTKRFHLCPDLPSGQTLSVSGEKYLTGDDFFLFGILLQLPAQLAREQNGANLPLQRNLRMTVLDCAQRDVFHLADTDARGADGFH